MRVYLAALVAVTACGGTPADDAVGVYQVILHTANDAGCTEGDPVVDPMFISFDYFGTMEGARTYSVSACTSSDAATCDDILAFITEDSMGGLSSSFQTAFQSGPDCLLDYIAYYGVLIDNTFELRSTTYEETQTNPPSCTPEDAAARGANMPCIAVEHLVGDRL